MKNRQRIHEKQNQKPEAKRPEEFRPAFPKTGSRLQTEEKTEAHVPDELRRKIMALCRTGHEKF
jgi:hypothetical protein